jgi:hypothetical protein
MPDRTLNLLFSARTHVEDNGDALGRFRGLARRAILADGQRLGI